MSEPHQTTHAVQTIKVLSALLTEAYAALADVSNPAEEDRLREIAVSISKCSETVAYYHRPQSNAVEITA